MKLVQIWCNLSTYTQKKETSINLSSKETVVWCVCQNLTILIFVNRTAGPTLQEVIFPFWPKSLLTVFISCHWIKYIFLNKSKKSNNPNVFYACQIFGSIIIWKYSEPMLQEGFWKRYAQRRLMGNGVCFVSIKEDFGVDEVSSQSLTIGKLSYNEKGSLLCLQLVELNLASCRKHFGWYKD